MNNFRYVLVAFIFAGLIVGCSDDDDGLGDSYFPTPSGHSWVYDNVYKSSGSEQSGQETLTVASVSDGQTGFESTVEDTYRRGTLTESLANGFVEEIDGKMLYTGDFAFVRIDQHTSLSLPVVDLTILDENNVGETVLYKEDNVTAVDDDFEVVLAGTVTTKYSLTVTQKAPVSLENYGDQVIPVELRFDVHTLLLEVNDVEVDTFEPEAEDGRVVVTNYFVKGKGLVESETQTTIEFRTIVDLVEEILGQPKSATELEDVGAPNLQPIHATLTQTVRN